MTTVTYELTSELLKRIHHDVSETKMDIREVKVEMHAMRGTMISMQQDIHNIYSTLARHDQRLDRIERRFELRELSEAQARFEQHP